MQQNSSKTHYSSLNGVKEVAGSSQVVEKNGVGDRVQTCDVQLKKMTVDSK